MSVEDPFILGSGSVLPGNYKDVLNVEEKEGVMGYIEIPAIDVMLPIYHGVSERVLRRGVGHMETTALPIGGKGYAFGSCIPQRIVYCKIVYRFGSNEGRGFVLYPCIGSSSYL